MGTPKCCIGWTAKSWPWSRRTPKNFSASPNDRLFVARKGEKLKNYFAKIRTDGACPPRPAASHVLWSWAGGLAGIAATAYLTHLTGAILLMAPFGATCVLAFGIPDSPLAQPRNIVGGHLLSSLIGLVFLALFGNAWWVM